MICFKKILCPIDYSDSSFNALKYAIEMTIKDSAVLFLMHVFDGHVFNYRGLKFETEHSHDSETIAIMEKKLRNNIPQEMQHHIKVETLITVGTHGRTDITQKLIGSVTERVVRNAPCPVLCIRNY